MTTGMVLIAIVGLAGIGSLILVDLSTERMKQAMGILGTIGKALLAVYDDLRLEPEIMQTYSQEEYEQYMIGYRLGYPLVGEPSVTVPAPSNPMFQRGLREGHAAFEQAGQPQISYENRMKCLACGHSGYVDDCPCKCHYQAGISIRKEAGCMRSMKEEATVLAIAVVDVRGGVPVYEITERETGTRIELTGQGLLQLSAWIAANRSTLEMEQEKNVCRRCGSPATPPMEDCCLVCAKWLRRHAARWRKQN